MKVQNISKERTYVTIDLEAFRQNIRKIYAWSNVPLIAVIKTDGYGHGAVRLAEELEQFSFVWGYAVATIEEAVALREAGVKKRILILGYVFPTAYETLLKYQVTPTIFDMESAEALCQEAEKQNKVIPVHIKVDTGMSRIGLPAAKEGIETAKRIASLDALAVEGIFTHLARADEWDHAPAQQQIDRFRAFCGKLEEEGVSIPLKHCANSAGIIGFESANMDLVRAGIIIYGLMPSDEVSADVIALQPVLSWKSTVAYVKTLPAGVPVSYGGTYITSEETAVATIPIGYGDGYPRLLSNRGFVLIRGRRAPIIGRVCMDQFMVDVTKIEGVSRGDTVTLIGKDQEEEIHMEELAGLCDTINYEIACNINKRVPRIYQ